MSPRPPFANGSNETHRNFKLCGQIPADTMIVRSGSNFPRLYRSQFSAISVLTARDDLWAQASWVIVASCNFFWMLARPMLVAPNPLFGMQGRTASMSPSRGAVPFSVCHVLFGSGPIKVFWSVVVSIAIAVGGMVFRGWRVSVERLAHHPVNLPSQPDAIDAENVPSIPALADELQDTPVSLHSTQRRNGIGWSIANWPPNFFVFHLFQIYSFAYNVKRAYTQARGGGRFV